MFRGLRDNCNFLLMKLKWKKKNSHNKTNPGKLFDANKVKIGKYTYGRINVHTFSNDDSVLKIGNYCSIAGSAEFILGGEHPINTLFTYPMNQVGLEMGVETKSKGSIIVEDDVWLGEHALVLSGVKIGKGAIIGAGSVVTKDIPPYAIVGGVPARIIKFRFPEIVIRNLLKLNYTEIDPNCYKDLKAMLNKELQSEEDLLWIQEVCKNEK